MMHLRRERCALLVIDVQDRLARAMAPETRDAVERNVTILLEAARRFAIPVVVSQQYPHGLGETTARVAAALDGLTGLHRFDKIEFSACAAAGFPVLEREQWIVTGMESHVCVWQTVRDLLGRGAEVFVVADAVASRTEANRALGLELARKAGATIVPTETVVFDLLGKAGTEDFKALSKLIK